MAEGILGLGSGSAAQLNQETIDKLKAADRKAQVEPIEQDISNYDAATEIITTINNKVTELQDAIKAFDLFNSTGTNSFEQMAATTTGTAATFEALDSGTLTPGTISVTVTQLAQRDVYQSVTFSDANVQIADGNDAGDRLVLSQSDRPVYQSDTTTSAPSTDIVDATGGTITLDGTNDFVVTSTMTYTELSELINAHASYSASIVNDRLSITNADGTSTVTIADSSGKVSSTIGLTLGEKFSTEGKTYAELASVINDTNPNYSASIEQVGTADYRMVLRSADTGTENAITITQTGFDLGLNDGGNKLLTAQNFQGTIDGVTYDVASNTVTTQGVLNITAVEAGTSTISITRDTSSILTTAQNLATVYNELATLVNDEIFSADSPVDDLSAYRTMMTQIRDFLFGDYGTNDDQNIFSYGFELDKDGVLTVNATTFSGAIGSNFSDLKSLFIGVAEDEGLGTQLKRYIDDINGFDGLLYTYDTSRIERKERLDEELENAIEDLDTKYNFLAQQFSEYGNIINQMEASFSGLRLMIEQSVATG